MMLPSRVITKICSSSERPGCDAAVRYERQLVAQRLQLAAEADARCRAADDERRQERERHAADLARLAEVCDALQ